MNHGVCGGCSGQGVSTGGVRRVCSLNLMSPASDEILAVGFDVKSNVCSGGRWLAGTLGRHGKVYSTLGATALDEIFAGNVDGEPNIIAIVLKAFGVGLEEKSRSCWLVDSALSWLTKGSFSFLREVLSSLTLQASFCFNFFDLTGWT